MAGFVSCVLIGGRCAVFSRAGDGFVGVGEFSMSPCTDADVIAKLPVVKIMLALAVVCPCGGFVLLVMVAFEIGAAEFIELDLLVVVG